MWPMPLQSLRVATTNSSEENTLFDLRVKVTQNITQYPWHHVTYAPANFEVATSNGLGVDAFTRKYIIDLGLKVTQNVTQYGTVGTLYVMWPMQLQRRRYIYKIYEALIYRWMDRQQINFGMKIKKKVGITPQNQGLSYKTITKDIASICLAWYSCQSVTIEIDMISLPCTWWVLCLVQYLFQLCNHWYWHHTFALIMASIMFGMISLLTVTIENDIPLL